MSEFVENVQLRLKKSSSSLLTLSLRVLTGMILGLTFALVGQEILLYGNFSFFLVITAMTLGFLRLSRSWGTSKVLVFDVICVLVGMLLKMYILVAPGA